MKEYSILVVVAVFFLLSCSPEEPKDSSGRLQLQLDSLIEAEHSSNQFSGTIVIGNNDSILFSKSFGSANRFWDIPLKLNHRFDVCSINKSFVAALILKAVEEQKLRLDDLLVDKLKPYSYNGSFDDNITIHQMLSHTSGLPDYNAVGGNNQLSYKRLGFSNDSYVNFISQLEPRHQPGHKFFYSNFAYHLLSILLEDLYQQPFSEILQQKILDPLGMEHTFNTTTNQAVYSQVVKAYNYNEKESVWNRNNFIDLTLVSRIFSSTVDLYKWGKAMNDNSILNDESIKLMQTNHLWGLDQDLSYGYGWVVFDGIEQYKMGDLQIDKKYIIHGGRTEDHNSMLVNIEKGAYIIAILANSGDQANNMKVTQKIAEILINTGNEN